MTTCSFEFAKHVGIDTIQIMTETPLPGTRLYQQAKSENRLITDDWALYDGHHAVMRPAQMHPRDLQLATVRAMERFYSLPRIVFPAIRGLLRHAPEVARLTLRNRTPGQLPILTSLVRNHRWQELLSSLTTRLSETDRRTIEEALAIPMLRAYGRRQLAMWNVQEHSLAYLEQLAALP